MKAIPSSRRKLTPKIEFVIIAVITLFTLSVFIYLYISKASLFGWYPFNSGDNSSVNYNPPTNEEKNAGNNTKNESLNSPIGESDQTKPDPEQNSADNTPSTGTIGVIITSISPSSPIDKTKGPLQIRTLVETVSSRGICTLTMSRVGSETISQTAGVQPTASSSTCKGFTVPVSTLASGSWQLTISYSDSDVQGKATQEIIIN